MELAETQMPEPNSSETATGKVSSRGKGKPVVTLDSEILGDVEIRLTAMLGEGTLKVSQLLALGEGSLVELDTPLDGQIDLVLNDTLIAKGEIVAVDDHFGVRITHVIAAKK